MLAFCGTAPGMARFWKIPSNVAHFLKVQRAIEDAVAFYKEIM
jgi:hypothetical protein